ncbi:ribbon-helix-helix protein, CopG family [Methanobacterium aggregans]|nr:ribbon-helix-helix protein, CopG family [Methanobacterium aggregans]MBP2045143.1 Arc/MetJ-type ribon-helix-helix transcriptional regulator [Methanobacterium aggregans]
MKVAKSVTLDLKDMHKIEEKIKKGETSNFSHFVRLAIQEKLER